MAAPVDDTGEDRMPLLAVFNSPETLPERFKDDDEAEEETDELLLKVALPGDASRRLLLLLPLAIVVMSFSLPSEEGAVFSFI